MSETICDTSPLLYLYRIGTIDLLPNIFEEIWCPNAVVDELREGCERGYDVPNPGDYSWLQIVDPKSMPSEWLSLDLGAGELAVMALALEYPARIVLLDDGLARRIAKAAGLNVWGTLKLLLEGKSIEFVKELEPLVSRLTEAGMWISSDIKERILALAGEKTI